MKILSLVLRLAICFIVDFLAVKGIGSLVPVYKREFMWQWFTGTWEDWLGLILFNVFMIAMGLWVFSKKVTVGEEVGSVGKSIVIGFVLPIVFLLLIYIR